jgi:uncharacterized protein YejL (UPF0352 family)
MKTESNSKRKNGYCETAYWHPDYQQVVMVRLGTKRTSLGAYFTDVVDMLSKHHVPQTDSATSLANMVVKLLREFHQVKGTNFQVLFTGY